MAGTRTAVLIASLLGCAGTGTGDAGASKGKIPEIPTLDFAAVLDTVVLDTKTPDHALQSWWHWNAVNDSLGILDKDLPLVRASRAKIEKREAAILGGDALKSYAAFEREPHETFRREIVEVKNESDTRAIVVARITNTTPIPSGATPTEYDQKLRRDGEIYRYVFERDSTGWKLTQVQEKSVLSDTTWEDHYKPYAESVPSWVTP